MQRNATLRSETSSLVRTPVLAVLSLFATVACGPEAAPTSGEAPEISGEISEDLRSQLRWLPWRGGVATPDQHSSKTSGLSVVYGIDVYHTSSAVQSLTVWWYEPSGADNQWRQGDPWGGARLGPPVPGGVTMTRQDCPDGFVAAGYRIAVNQAKTKIVKLGLTCRNLFDDSDIVHLPTAGSSSAAYIPEILRCGDFPEPPPPGYLQYIYAQTDMSGMGARCVLPR